MALFQRCNGPADVEDICKQGHLEPVGTWPWLHNGLHGPKCHTLPSAHHVCLHVFNSMVSCCPSFAKFLPLRSFLSVAYSVMHQAHSICHDNSGINKSLEHRFQKDTCMGDSGLVKINASNRI